MPETLEMTPLSSKIERDSPASETTPMTDQSQTSGNSWKKYQENMAKYRCSICLFGLTLFLSLSFFVIIPVVFKYSVGLQRLIVFPAFVAESQNYSDVQKYGLKGVRNFYITVDEKENVTLGAWQILPSQLLGDFADNEYHNYEGLLANKNYNILLYLHANGVVRSQPLVLYTILRNYFHIIAPDYRGYADSTTAELTENNVVNDIVSLYKWIRSKTKARIFVWGHSLGTAIGTHTISNLKSQNMAPSGLVLEAPFSTFPDAMEHNFFVKITSWLPWYRTTWLDPIVDNGFEFKSTKYIVNVDCPIMILHAKDDLVVPHELATKLYETAIKNRNFTTQGNVTYHLFEAKGYKHMHLYLAPELPKYVRKFVQECVNFENLTELFEL